MEKKKKLSPVVSILIGIVVGLIVGILANQLKLTWLISACGFLGDLFLRLLRMLVAPLILASLTVGVFSTGSISRLGKLGAKTLLYFIATTAIAVALGILLVNLIRPGLGVSILGQAVSEEIARTQGLRVIDIILKIVPTNPFKALAETEVLGIIFIAIVLGFGLVALGDQAAGLREFFLSFDRVMLYLTSALMKVAPIGVGALLAEIIGQMGLQPMIPLAKYMLTVFLGLVFQTFVILPVILWAFTGLNPYRFIAKVFPVMATAFSTSSSNATLPVSMGTMQNEIGVSEKVVSFVLPLGATINMNGTALYEAVAAIFIAQAYGIDLTFAQQSIIFLTAILAAIGTPGMPQAGLFTMVIILEAVGLPVKGVGLILAVDRVLDMMRTVVNVYGDLTGAVIIAKSEGERIDLSGKKTDPRG